MKKKTPPRREQHATRQQAELLTLERFLEFTGTPAALQPSGVRPALLRRHAPSRPAALPALATALLRR